jgi:peroxiredoxin
MKTKTLLFILLLSAFSHLSLSQGTDASQDNSTGKATKALKDLKKAEPGDIDPGKPIMLDPTSIPMYNEDMALLQGFDFMQAMMSGDYIPEPYIDSTKTIKAFVLRKATALEKERIQKMQPNMQNPMAESKALIGKGAEPFNATDITGSSYSLEKLKGKVIVMNFWFVECKPCVMEIPELNTLVEKYKGKNVVFLGFATNDKSSLENFITRKTFLYNLIADSREIAQKYSVDAFPTHVIIDQESNFAYFSTGLGPTTIVDLDKTIESLLK